MLPEGAIITALDPGNSNVYARATDGHDIAPSPAAGKPYAGRKGRGAATDPNAKLAVLSTKQFYHEAGRYKRRRRLELDLARERRDNPEFVAAEALAVAAAAAEKAATTHAEFVTATQMRGKAASQLSRFYQRMYAAKNTTANL